MAPSGKLTLVWRPAVCRKPMMLDFSRKLPEGIFIRNLLPIDFGLKLVGGQVGKGPQRAGILFHSHSFSGGCLVQGHKDPRMIRHVPVFLYRIFISFQRLTVNFLSTV